mmetsp:Transcript_13557/g.42601  ORF Transcript_13557/g.42601 Transcript_13557/m.42601 type:complete len:242 (-) Transcript_13557:230-955(-)
MYTLSWRCAVAETTLDASACSAMSCAMADSGCTSPWRAACSAMRSAAPRCASLPTWSRPSAMMASTRGHSACTTELDALVSPSPADCCRAPSAPVPAPASARAPMRCSSSARKLARLVSACMRMAGSTFAPGSSAAFIILSIFFSIMSAGRAMKIRPTPSMAARRTSGDFVLRRKTVFILCRFWMDTCALSPSIAAESTCNGAWRHKSPARKRLRCASTTSEPEVAPDPPLRRSTSCLSAL